MVAVLKQQESRLKLAKHGRLTVPNTFLFYGPQGVGKSSLGSDAPAPIFLDIEGGSHHIDVTRYQFSDGPRGHIPQSFAEVLAALDDLANTRDHGFQTVVVDTVDAVETLIHQKVCAANQWTNIGEPGFRKGFDAALPELRVFLARLDRVKAAGISVIALGHSIVKPVKNPSGDAFDRYQLRTDSAAAEQLKDWFDVVGFFHFEEGSMKDSRFGKAKGWASGVRLIETRREAAWDAKARIPLPAVVTVDSDRPWAPIAAAISDLSNMSTDELHVSIEAELVRIGDEIKKDDGTLTTTAAIRSFTPKASRDQLTRTLALLRNNPTKKAE
jgi:hypothetical protein